MHTPTEALSDEALTPTWAWIQIKQEIMKDKISMEMEEIAPPGDLERKIQEYIDENSSK